MEDLQKTGCLVTYCSRDKDPAEFLMPAGHRYLSPRIKATSRAAVELKVGFFILSGLYGLIHEDHPIPDYDHLLTSGQVPDHAEMVARQLDASRVTRVVFVTRSMTVDAGVGPYREVMRRACEEVGVPFEVVELPDHEISSAELAALVISSL